jgi:hypothetical protein
VLIEIKSEMAYIAFSPYSQELFPVIKRLDSECAAAVGIRYCGHSSIAFLLELFRDL